MMVYGIPTTKYINYHICRSTITAYRCVFVTNKKKIYNSDLGERNDKNNIILSSRVISSIENYLRYNTCTERYDSALSNKCYRVVFKLYFERILIVIGFAV